MRQVIKKHEKISFRFLGVVLAALCLVSLSSCDRNPFSGSKLTSANYDRSASA